MKLQDVGTTVATSLVEFFKDPNNILLIDNLKKSGLTLSVENDSQFENKLEGKKFVVTGTLENFDRNAIIDAIELNGGIISSSVSSKTDFVIRGNEPGQKKIENAEKLKINIISEKEFIDMIS